ncbi:MAG: DUF1003 domain-containing protein [Flavobacteriales bacterium]|nr:DUF1003 domain-containing protein [Flavobacteriales bacterium]
MAKTKRRNELDGLLTARNERMHKLQGIVKDAIDEQELIINNLANPPQEAITHGQRLADKVASFGGSWTFIVSFFIVLTAWITYNAMAPRGDNFDPYPFILMNLILSCVAALQAPVIMMSQNRQEEKDRKRSENDYLINLKAELELRSLHQKMDLLLQDEVRSISEVQEKQFKLLGEMERQLSKLTAARDKPIPKKDVNDPKKDL